ncbi:hypothetical protein HK096_006738, partial [Nowakowskiella sp. JEL0078]
MKVSCSFLDLPLDFQESIIEFLTPAETIRFHIAFSTSEYSWHCSSHLIETVDLLIVKGKLSWALDCVVRRIFRLKFVEKVNATVENSRVHNLTTNKFIFHLTIVKKILCASHESTFNGNLQSFTKWKNQNERHKFKSIIQIYQLFPVELEVLVTEYILSLTQTEFSEDLEQAKKDAPHIISSLPENIHTIEDFVKWIWKIRSLVSNQKNIPELNSFCLQRCGSLNHYSFLQHYFENRKPYSIRDAGFTEICFSAVTAGNITTFDVLWKLACSFEDDNWTYQKLILECLEFSVLSTNVDLFQYLFDRLESDQDSLYSMILPRLVQLSATFGNINAMMYFKKNFIDFDILMYFEK